MYAFSELWYINWNVNTKTVAVSVDTDIYYGGSG